MMSLSDPACLIGINGISFVRPTLLSPRDFVLLFEGIHIGEWLVGFLLGFQGVAIPIDANSKECLRPKLFNQTSCKTPFRNSNQPMDEFAENSKPMNHLGVTAENTPRRHDRCTLRCHCTSCRGKNWKRTVYKG